MEFFDDNTALLSHMTDGDPAAACSFTRVPVTWLVRTCGVGDPSRLLRFGHTRTCLIRIEGRILLLACAEGEEPPLDILENFVTLGPIEAASMRPP